MTKEKEEIIENSKVLAKFSGFTVKKKPIIGYNLYYRDKTPVLKFSVRTEKLMWEELNESKFFHNSWDWLMPVVEKCREIWNEFDLDSEENVLLESEIFNLDNTLADFLNADIGAIYRRVVEFTKWFNNERK